MKKLILLLLLLLITTTVFAQGKQYKVVYDETFSSVADSGMVWGKNTNTIIYNYQNKAKVKIIKTDGTVEIWKKTGKVTVGKTEGGTPYVYTDYVGKYGLTLTIQKFGHHKNWIRLIFDDNKSIELRKQ